MKNLVLLFSVLLTTPFAFAKHDDGRLLEDCKYVSLNNSIRLAYQDASAAGLSLSEKSREAKSPNEDTLVFTTFGAQGQALGEHGYKLSLNDPQNGFCSLQDSTAASIHTLSTEEIAALTVLPEDDDARYWNACNTNALNVALNQWAQLHPSIAPHIEYTSARVESETNKKERTYTFVLSASNGDLIVTNPLRADSKIGQKTEASQTRFVFTATKKKDVCNFGSVTID